MGTWPNFKNKIFELSITLLMHAPALPVFYTPLSFIMMLLISSSVYSFLVNKEYTLGPDYHCPDINPPPTFEHNVPNLSLPIH